MYNPFRGIDPTDPFDWLYLLALFLTPFVLLVCLLTIWGPGWFLGLLWVLLILWLEPEEVEQGRHKRRQEKLSHANQRPGA